MILEEAAKLCEETLLPINQIGDLKDVLQSRQQKHLRDLKKHIKNLLKMDGKD